MIRVDKSSSTPLYKQVYESVRRDIIDGVWKPGEKIPSIRNLMSDPPARQSMVRSPEMTPGNQPAPRTASGNQPPRGKAGFPAGI